MRILITGGAGYKGVVLTRKLLEKGYKVTILDNFIYGYTSILDLVTNSNLEIIKMDIRNLNKKIVADFDIIYHLAACSGMPACAANPHSAEVINVEATHQLVSSLQNNKSIKDSIICGSAAAAIVVTKVGCSEAMPTTKELELFIKNNKILKFKKN